MAERKDTFDMYHKLLKNSKCQTFPILNRTLEFLVLFYTFTEIYQFFPALHLFFPFYWTLTIALYSVIVLAMASVLVANVMCKLGCSAAHVLSHVDLARKSLL